MKIIYVNVAALSNKETCRFQFSGLEEFQTVLYCLPLSEG